MMSSGGESGAALGLFFDMKKTLRGYEGFIVIGFLGQEFGNKSGGHAERVGRLPHGWRQRHAAAAAEVPHPDDGDGIGGAIRVRGGRLSP